jgi:hypothetical protein
MAKLAASDLTRIARTVQAHEQGPRDNRMPGTGHHPVSGDSLPTGSKYQVLMVIDDANTIAFDWPRCH